MKNSNAEIASVGSRVPRDRATQSWPMVRLGDVCDASTSQIRQKDLESNSGEFPIYGASGLITKVAFYQSKTECLGVVKDGAGVGRVMYLPPFSSVIGTVLIIKPRPSIINQYLYHVLVQLDLGAVHSGATIPHVYFKDFKDRSIPLPPLSVQREIVTRLEKELGEADALAAKFKEIAENADAEFKAELDETFKNVEGEKVRLGEVCEIERGRSKTRPRNSPELFGGPYPFVQTGDVKKANGGTIISYTQTYSEKGLRQSRLWKKGTLCVTIAANIGEAALLGFDACFPDSVVGITSKGTLSLDFLNYYFYATKSKLFEVAPGTAQKNFNVERLSHVEIVMPKMAQQHEAITKLHMVKAKCEKLKAAAERGLRAAEDLRKAILAEAFEQ